jgi:hypothetical protein
MTGDREKIMPSLMATSLRWRTHSARTNGFKAIDSDHYTQYMDVNLEQITEKSERKEVFNVHDKK